MNHLPPSPGFKNDFGSNTIVRNVVTQISKLTTKSETDKLCRNEPASGAKETDMALGSICLRKTWHEAGLTVSLDLPASTLTLENTSNLGSSGAEEVRLLHVYN
jgi:hypothetical protein